MKHHTLFLLLTVYFILDLFTFTYKKINDGCDHLEILKGSVENMAMIHFNDSMGKTIILCRTSHHV